MNWTQFLFFKFSYKGKIMRFTYILHTCMHDHGHYMTCFLFNARTRKCHYYERQYKHEKFLSKNK